jgi:hypothetical protein
MKTLLKSRTFLGVTVLLALALVAGALWSPTVSAQGPGGNPPNFLHDNQAVLDLLKATEPDLYQLRQAGKSWLDIATSKGVTEAALLDALLKPVNDRHAWMAQQYPQFNATQMTEWMRTQLTNDLRVTQFGTIADRHVFGGGGMMGGWYNNNNFGGMRGGMMGRWNNYGFGGMMHRWWTAPGVTPVPSQ